MGKVKTFTSVDQAKQSEEYVTHDLMGKYIAVMLAPIVQKLGDLDQRIVRLISFLASDGMEVWKDRQFDSNGIPFGGTFVGNTWMDVEKYAEFIKLMAQEEADAEKEAANRR